MTQQTPLEQLFDGYAINSGVASSDHIALSISSDQPLCVNLNSSDKRVLHSGEVVVLWSNTLDRTSIIHAPPDTTREQTRMKRFDRANPFQALAWCSQALAVHEWSNNE